MLSTQVRSPWWHWALLSLCTTLFVTVTTLVLLVALAFRGVDVLDYVYLPHPPYLKDGLSAALLAGLFASGTLAPLLAVLFYRPGRAVTLAGFRTPADMGGTALRVVAGVAGAIVLQIGWAQVAPAQAEHWRIAEHLVYAVIGGSRFWPLFWLVLTLGVVVPLAEEALFRGLIFGLLRRRWGFMAGALGSAVMFGLAHGPVHALPTAALGFYLAYQAERDGSLAGAMALHALNNLGALVAITAAL